MKIEVGPGGKTTVTLSDAPAGQGPLVVVDGVTNILGGSGDDTIRFLKGATLKGWVDGGEGNNRLDYSSIPSSLAASATGYSVNLSKAKVGTIPTPTPANQLYFTDTLPLGGVARISVVTGSGKIDTLTGGIAGGIATVTLQGGLGDDKLRGNNESATLEGGLGSDTYIFLNEDFERYTANGTARQTITEKSNPADAEFAKWKANIDVLDLSKLTSKLPADSTNPAYLISATIDGLQVSQQRTGASNTSINLFSSSVKGLEKILSPSSTALTTYSFSNGWGNLAIEGLEPAMANLDFSRVTNDLLFEIGKNPIGSAPVSLTVSEAVSDGKGGWKAKVGGDRLTVTSSPGIPRQNLCRDLTGGLGNNHYKFIDHYSIAGDLKQAAGQLQGRQNTLDYSDYQSVAIDPRLRNAGVTTSLSSVTTPPPLVRPPVSQAFTAPGIPTAFKITGPEAYKRDPADNASTVYDGKVTLDWKAPTGSVAVSEYLVEFSKDNGKNWQRYATPTADKLATTLTIQPLEVDSSYTFQVSAVAAGGIVGLPTESTLARVPSPADATKPTPVAATPTPELIPAAPALPAISVALGANLFADPVKGNDPAQPTVVAGAVAPAQERWTFTSNMLKGSINFGGSRGGPEKTLTYDVSRYGTMQTSYEQQFKELAAGVLGRSDFKVALGLIKTGTAADSAVQSLTWSVKFSAPGGVDPQKYTALQNVIKDGQRPWAPTDTWAASNDLFEKIRTNKQGPAEGEYLTQLRELLARTNSGTTATGIKLARGTSPAGQKLITFTVSYRPGPGTSEKTPPYSALFRYYEDEDPDYPVFGVFDLGEDKAFVRWGYEPAPVPGDSGTFSQTLELGVPVGNSGQIIQPSDLVRSQVVLSLRDAAAVAPAAAPDFGSQTHPGRVAVDTIADISTTAKDGNFALAFEFDAQDGRRIGLTTADIPRNAAPGTLEKAIQAAVDRAVGPQVIPETGIGALTPKTGVSLLNKGVIDAKPVVTVSRGDGSTEFPWRIAFANMGQISWHSATAQQDDISLPVNAGVPAIIQAGKTTSVAGTVAGITRVIGSGQADTIRGVASESKQLFSFTSLTAGGYRLNTKSLTVADAGAVDVVNGLRRRQAVLYSVESTTADPFPEGSEIGGLKSGRIYFINTSVVPNPVAQSPATVPVVSFYETPDFSISKLSALSDSGIRLTLPTAGVDAVRHVFREVFTIDGGDGDDRITAAYDPLSAAQTRANYLVGSAGNDRIIGGLDADYIDGGAGDDFVVADAKPPVSRSTPTVLSWIDTVRGGAGADTVLGTSTGDILLGDAGNDTIIPGESGNQFLQGGDGNDSLVIGSRGSATDYHTLAGGDGNDTYKLTGSWGVASIRETARNGSADTIDLSSSTQNYVHILSNGSLYSTAGRLHNGTVTMDAAATAAGVAAIPLGTNTDLLTGTAVSYGQVLTQWGFGLHQAANGAASEVAINEAGNATVTGSSQPAVITAFAGSESTRANGQKFDKLDFQLRLDRGTGTTVYDVTLSNPTLNDGVYRIPEARQAEMLRAVLAAARVTHAAVPAWSLTETLDQNKARLT
ncbi:MAG: fibronectin type III domain-containing protein, partial [Planctomycetota bacterium]